MSRPCCAAVLGFLLLACSTAKPILPVSPPWAPRAASAGLRAGVAEGDITPTPGLALFGHGPEGRIALGMRSRLRCQAFVLDSSTDLVALVTCDLAAPDLELQRRVAARLLAKRVPIGGDRLFLMATHTHAGPAHYFTSRRYAGSFSSYRPGYDPHVVEFLVDRISAVIERAFRRLAPACAGWGAGDVYGLTRNRSYTPFAANLEKNAVFGAVEAFERKAVKAARSRPPAAAEATPSDETIALGAEPRSHTEAAVDPRLWVLRLDARDAQDDGQGCPSARPLGVLAIFGMHPTGVSNLNELYHGDIFGFATREVEACLRAEAHLGAAGRPVSCNDVALRDEDAPFVAGIANGIEGDVSPAVDFQASREAARLGIDLAHRILSVYDAIPARTGLVPHVPIEHAYRELELPGAQIAPGSPDRLCESPAIGAAAAGGAEDGPTRFRIIAAFNEGQHRRRSHGCHGAKLELVPPEGRAKSDGIQFPAVAPIALVRVGGLHLAMAPAELTTVAGSRLRASISRRLGSTAVAVVGLTNAYVQYVATREEYSYQHYEGASTLYGPGSSQFLSHQFECLADWIQTRRYGDGDYCGQQRASVNVLRPIEQHPAPIVRRLEEDERADPSDPITLTSAPTADDGLPGRQVHITGIPSSALAYREQFSASVVTTDGRRVDDDTGANMELRFDAGAWTLRWLPYITRADDPRCQQTYRILVRGHQEVSSEPFRLDCDIIRRLP